VLLVERVRRRAPARRRFHVGESVSGLFQYLL
jgi:hypothetical protein